MQRSILIILFPLLIWSCNNDDLAETETIIETIEITQQIPYEEVYREGERRARVTIQLDPIPAQYNILGEPQFLGLDLEVVQGFNSERVLQSAMIYKEVLGPRFVYLEENLGQGTTPFLDAITDNNGSLQNGARIKLFERESSDEQLIEESLGVDMLDNLYPEVNLILIEFFFDQDFHETIILNFIYTLRFQNIINP